MSSLDNTIVQTPDLTVKDMIDLTKPKIMLLVVFTALVAMVIAAKGTLYFNDFVSLLAIAMGSGGSAIFNMWYDRDIDQIMTRTRHRAIPAGKISSQDALAFAFILSLLSIILIDLSAGLAPAALLAFSIFFYSVIYTMWLKRNTMQNIVWGGAAGAFPPIIGWMCISNEVTLLPILLFVIIFLWTPPHFWALALYRNSDYTKANVPMMPVIKGERYTKLQIIFYTILMIASTLSLYFLNYCGVYYLVGSMVSGGYFLYLAIRLLVAGNDKRAIKLFAYSIFYLFFIFSLAMIDYVI